MTPRFLGVLYLPKYFINFINFISHAKSIYLKNISYDCGKTNHETTLCPTLWHVQCNAGLDSSATDLWKWR
jgi:hypothetical protein